jgi:cytochrome c oxidase subunit 2
VQPARRWIRHGRQGETTEISVTPDRIGTYTVRCAELCGLYHAYMQTDVRVVSSGDYATWLQGQAQPANAASTS